MPPNHKLPRNPDIFGPSLAHIVLVVFDLTDRQSFDSIAAWTNDFRDSVDAQKYVMILIGNKKDKFCDRAVSDREIWTIVNDLQFDAYTGTSALTGEGLDDAINAALSRTHQMVVDGTLRLDTVLNEDSGFRLRPIPIATKSRPLANGSKCIGCI